MSEEIERWQLSHLWKINHNRERVKKTFGFSTLQIIHLDINTCDIGTVKTLLSAIRDYEDEPVITD